MRRRGRPALLQLACRCLAANGLQARHPDGHRLLLPSAPSPPQAEQLAEAGLSASHIAATALSVLGKRQPVELGI